MQLRMPPPKKPKNGPTTIDQFIDRDELQEGSPASRVVRSNIQSHGVGTSIDTKEGLIWYEEAKTGYGTYLKSSPLSAPSDNKHAYQAKQRLSESLFLSESPKNSPASACAKSPTYSSPTPRSDNDCQNNSSYSSANATSAGSILERLFTTNSAREDSGENLYGETLSWQTKSQSPGSGYKLSTSNKLVSFFTKPDWKLGTKAPEEKPGHQQQTTSSLNIQGHQPAAFLSSIQQQNQQQHLVGRSILASLFSGQINKHCTDEELPVLSKSLTDCPRSSPNAYLSNLMRQSSGAYTSSGSLPSLKLETATHCSESSTVYLHPAFQLPPTTTSDVRKNTTSSSSCLPLSPQAVAGHNNAKPLAFKALQAKPTQGHGQVSFHGSILNSSGFSSVMLDDSLLDLSVKNVQALHKTALKNSCMVSALIEGPATTQGLVCSPKRSPANHDIESSPLKPLISSEGGRVTLSSPAVKKEMGSSADYQSESDQEGEPSDCKSPKAETRMVSPNSCMQVLSLGGSGEVGTAHLQAATSTTPESATGQLPHNFLMEVQAGGIETSPTQMKQEIGASVPGSSVQAKLCQVCNDNASGFHYGVWSCEGCKAFFKRSIQGPVDYICPATNTCTIDKHRRKSCQACRLRRCYEVGMNKGSQRKERKSSASTSGLKGKRCRADSSDSAINSTNNGASSSKVAKRSRSASILEALQKADLPVLESYHNHSLPATRVHLLNTLIKLSDRELVYLINWAKHVPGYTCLTLSDQVHLIECCWMELLLLNCAFRSMEHEGRTLVFAPDFHLERHQWALTGMGDVLEQVAAVSEQMVLYNLNKEELLLLQATVLVNAEVRRLDSFSKIQEMRQVILDVFMEVAGRHQGFSSWRHAPSILLLLTHIRQAGERGITYFQRLKMEGCVTFCDLLTEMLDAHNSSGERRRMQQQQHHHQQQTQQQQQQQTQHQQTPQHHQHPQHLMAPE